MRKQLDRRTAGRGMSGVLLALLGPVRAATARADDGSDATMLEVEPPRDGPAPAATEIDAQELQMLALVNGARLSSGVGVLRWDPAMAREARAHAAEMMARGIVSHTGSDGSSPAQRLRRAGVQCQFCSENIWAVRGDPSQAPGRMFSAMMAEPYQPGLWNHHGNIVYEGYKRLGVGFAVSSDGMSYVSLTFAE